MANDSEQQLYEDMAELRDKVPKLQNEIRSLKTRLTKLSGRVESLELMDFQSQISKLDDRVESVKQEILELAQKQITLVNTLKDSVLSVQQYMAGLRINSLSSDFYRIIKNQPSKQPSALITQLYADVASTKSTIKSSNTPLEVANQFQETWKNRLQELGLKLGSDFIEY